MGVGNIDRNLLEGSHSSPPRDNRFGQDGIQARRLLRLLTPGMTRQTEFWGRVCLGWLGSRVGLAYPKCDNEVF